MAYRTKYHNLIWNQYLNKVFDFIGLTIDSTSGCSLIKWIGCNYTKDNKPVPAYFLTMKYDRENSVDVPKINTLIRTQDEFFNYKVNKDKYEYFNPIIKYKQMLKLLLMMAPVVYDRYCVTDIKTEDGDIDDDLKGLVDMIVSDDDQHVSQEEIINHVNIKQYPSEPGSDGEMLYTYGVEISRKNGENCHFSATSKNKSVAILMLMIKVIELVDGDGIDMDERYFYDIQLNVEEMFDEYNKERERNYKDLKKVTIEKEVTDFTIQDSSEDSLEFITDSDDLLVPNMSSETEAKLVEENTDKLGTINISNVYQSFIPIMPKESDDDIDAGLIYI